MSKHLFWRKTRGIWCLVLFIAHLCQGHVCANRRAMEMFFGECITVGGGYARVKRVGPISWRVMQNVSSSNHAWLPFDIYDFGLMAMATNPPWRLSRAIVHEIDPRVLAVAETLKQRRVTRWFDGPGLTSEQVLQKSDYQMIREADPELQRGHTLPWMTFAGYPRGALIDMMSVLYPQPAKMNTGPWLALERLVHNYALASSSVVSVAMGPYYNPEVPQRDIIPGCPLPCGYWKVVAVPAHEETGCHLDVDAYLMPFDVPHGSEVLKYRISIQDLEERLACRFSMIFATANCRVTLASRVARPVFFPNYLYREKDLFDLD